VILFAKKHINNGYLQSNSPSALSKNTANIAIIANNRERLLLR
jgi:hypothetical protein